MDGWERKGECNHCGYCCVFLGHLDFKFRPAPGPNQETPDYHFLAVRGISLLPSEGMAVKKIDLFAPCPVYDMKASSDKTPGCRIYNERPLTCSEFPDKPSQITDTPCSFYFEREVDGVIEKIGGKGSPYPANNEKK